jgi:hypothetical protein
MCAAPRVHVLVLVCASRRVSRVCCSSCVLRCVGGMMGGLVQRNHVMRAPLQRHHATTPPSFFGIPAHTREIRREGRDCLGLAQAGVCVCRCVIVSGACVRAILSQCVGETLPQPCPNRHPHPTSEFPSEPPSALPCLVWVCAELTAHHHLRLADDLGRSRTCLASCLESRLECAAAHDFGGRTLFLVLPSGSMPPLLFSCPVSTWMPPLGCLPSSCPCDWVATTAAHLDATALAPAAPHCLLLALAPTNAPECAAGASDARLTARHTARQARHGDASHPSRAPSTPTSRPAQWRSQWGRRGSGRRGGGGAWPPAGERGLGRERARSVGSPPCHREPERKPPPEGAMGGADTAANKSRCLSRQSAAERSVLLLLRLSA